MRTIGLLLFLSIAQLATPAATVAQLVYPGTPIHPGVLAGPMPGLATPELGPEAIVRQGMDRLNGLLSRSGPQSPAVINAFLEREIAPHVDFAYMAQWVAGPAYGDISDHQRRRFAAHLSQRFLNALARNLKAYSWPPPHFEIDRPRPGRSQGEIVVSARVQPANDYPVQLGFRFYRSPQGWRIFDVTANGFSALAHYREYYRTLTGRYGPESFMM